MIGLLDNPVLKRFFCAAGLDIPVILVAIQLTVFLNLKIANSRLAQIADHNKKLSVLAQDSPASFADQGTAVVLDQDLNIQFLQKVVCCQNCRPA